jgi:predicted GNAT family acetyltransferase
MTNGMEQEIKVERSGRQGFYFLPLPDADPARLTFVEVAPDQIAIDYSWVPPPYRGRGVALKLIKRAVEDARAQGFKITPLCGYVASEFRHHPDWADVLARRQP